MLACSKDLCSGYLHACFVDSNLVYNLYISISITIHYVIFTNKTKGNFRPKHDVYIMGSPALCFDASCLPLHSPKQGKNIRRPNVDAYFVLSLGGKSKQ